MNRPDLTRRAAVAALAFGAALGVQAQERFPSKPITIVVPQAAGGANDAIARVLGQKLSQQLGQSVVIDNRPGAGGNIGTAWTAKAKPDGYTVTVNGKHEVLSISIAPEAVDPDDVEMLQDMIVGAVNEAMRKADTEASQNLSRLTGGLNLGGLF